MKGIGKWSPNSTIFSGLLLLVCLPWMLSLASAFEPLKGDMSSFDPNRPEFPISGDTIRVGLLMPFSGSAAFYGEMSWLVLGWVVHDINSQGGILVDGKRKKIQIIKGDTQVKPDIAKRVAERLCLEDKVDVIIGTSGSHINLVGQGVAAKFKRIYMNLAAFSDSLHDGKNFNRYTFRTCGTTTTLGSAMAYYYSTRPERKFYILCPDYLAGHDMAESFKQGMKKFKRNAEIVGEAYHPLWTKDFAPYLTKIKGSGAEVIFTVDWAADAQNLIKQSRQMGVNLPLAGPHLDDPQALETIGGPAGRGIVTVYFHQCSFDHPKTKAFNELWHQQWKGWKKPYGSIAYAWPFGWSAGASVPYCYWLFDVIRRAGSADAEKIIKIWEGDEYQSVTGAVLKMRACDHQAIQDLYVSQLDFPTKWYPNAAGYTKAFVVPSRFCMPPMAEDLERCKK
jgi:ABC-type branched-subunit amino acid transport system substrate-binding protein